MVRRILSAALIGMALLGTAPAMAGGSIGVTVSASNADGRRAISRFLQVYTAGNAAVEVIQKGSGNAAAVSQTGRGNRAVVSQRGADHRATVYQRGRGNRLGVFQFGEATDANVTQTGRRGASLIFMGGW